MENLQTRLTAMVPTQCYIKEAISRLGKKLRLVQQQPVSSQMATAVAARREIRMLERRALCKHLLEGDKPYTHELIRDEHWLPPTVTCCRVPIKSDSTVF
jgi:hypothetical protein